VGRLTEGSIRTKSDRPEPDVEPLVVDDLGSAAVLRRCVCVKAKQKVGVRLGTRLDPRAEEGVRGISSGGGDKLVGRNGR